MLETHDLQTLKRAFSFADHEFTRGFVYLTEDAITNRIEEVDPAWQFDILNIVHEGNNAICHARLTIKGVARDGVGMQQIMEKAGEPAKGAATDALKRCARLFGIGRYLLNAPKEGKEFNAWLTEQQKAQPRPPQPPQPPQPSPAPTPPPPSSSASSPASAGASANALPTTTVGADGKIPFEQVFQTTIPVTNDALYAKVSGLFNARVHFENWWAKHADALKKKTLEEAVLYARDDHWYRDADKVKQFFEFGKSMLNLTTNQIMSALNNVNDRDMLKVSEWSGGNVNMAQAALWAYHANYDPRSIQALNLDKDMQLMAAQWCEVAAAKEKTSA